MLIIFVKQNCQVSEYYGPLAKYGVSMIQGRPNIAYTYLRVNYKVSIVKIISFQTYQLADSIIVHCH